MCMYYLVLNWKQASKISFNFQLIWSTTLKTNCQCTLRKKPTIHQVTTMLATSKNVLFLGHKHLLTTGTDDP